MSYHMANDKNKEKNKMAYVCEWVPENEKRGYMIPGYKEIIPGSWVIDREKNIKLFKYWTNIDEPHEKYFALVYKELVNKVVLISDYIGGNTVRWKAYYPLNLSEELVHELREAMKVYRCSGSPISSSATADVVIDF